MGAPWGCPSWSRVRGLCGPVLPRIQLGQGPHLPGLDSGKPWVTGRPEGLRRGSCQANIPTGPAGRCVPSTHREALPPPPAAALLPSPQRAALCPSPGSSPTRNPSLRVLQGSSSKPPYFPTTPSPALGPGGAKSSSPTRFNRDIASARNPPCLGPSHLQASLGP